MLMPGTSLTPLSLLNAITRSIITVRFTRALLRPIILNTPTTGPITPPYEGDTQYGAFYSQISGTSMATPHISGVTALILEANPKLNMDGVLKAMTSTARPMYYRDTPDNGLDPQQGPVKKRALWEVGAGYVDAYAAVKRAFR